MSGKYLVARDAFGNGDLRWTDGQIFAQLVASEFSFNERDQSLGDISSQLVGDPVGITGARFEAGWARCNEIRFDQVRGEKVGGVVFHEDSGMLIEYHDAIENFPMQPNGGDIIVQIQEPGIFRI